MLWGGYVARQRHCRFRHVLHEAGKGARRSTRLDIKIVPREAHIEIDPLHHLVSERQLKDLPTIDGVLTANQYLDYYVKQYLNHGIHPTLNWYRQRRTNWEEDQALLDKKIINQPVLFIQATHDGVLKPAMAKSMDNFIPKLTKREVEAAHWALIQKPEETNAIIRQWLEVEGLVGKKRRESSL